MSVNYIKSKRPSDNVFPALCPEPPEPLSRGLLDALNHHHQVAPFHLVAVALSVVLGQLETAGLQTLHVHHHAAVLRMEQLHQPAAPPDEDEHVAVAHVALHPLMHHAAERADALAHVCPSRTEKVAHRVVKAEHGKKGFCPTTP